MMKITGIFINKPTTLLIIMGLFVCLFSVFSIFGQSDNQIFIQKQLQKEFDNGNFQKTIEVSELIISKAKKTNNTSAILLGLEINIHSKIFINDYIGAENLLSEALKLISKYKTEPAEKYRIFICASWLFRQQGKFTPAIEYAKKALAEMPQNLEIEGEYYLNIGRILFAQSFDISAIIWLEKAEKIFESKKTSNVKLDTLRYLSHAWASRSNYQAALKYSEKLVSISENTRFKYKHRQSLYDWGIFLSATGQKQKAYNIFDRGLNISVKEKNDLQVSNFLLTLVLNALYDKDLVKVAEYLKQIEIFDRNKSRFTKEILLAKAVLSAYTGQVETAEKLFSELEKQKNISEYLLPTWKRNIAENGENWEKVIKYNQIILKLNEKYNFRDDLSGTHLRFANAYFHLNETEKSLWHLEKSIALIEEIRSSNNTNFTIGILETYHNAYRLLTQIKSGNFQKSFELSDFIKARILKDRIKKTFFDVNHFFSAEKRKKLEELSNEFINGKNKSNEIEKIEKGVTAEIADMKLEIPNLRDLDNIRDLDGSALISYFFKNDKKLLAFVWEFGKPAKVASLPVTEDEIEILAKATRQNIKNQIFFKKDGKEIHDKLLKPLNISAKHLIIIPDKSIWKIPFQALSSDGEKYLIEEKLISYAPSVSILLDQLKAPKPKRQTLQAFANSSFETKLLQYVNSEALTVAGIYNSKPIINATARDFSRVSEKFDILHFSMHAEVAGDQPLDSFLGFRKIGIDDGRLTVEELLNIKIKKGSLVFLASCDSNNVLSSEGLVSLAWGMMGSGATTVISSQWEANDKSTAIFTKTFYEHYKQGISSAESLQKASLELIKNKSGNMHEPYFWADFTLTGDFR